jgi:hypothetical protein
MSANARPPFQLSSLSHALREHAVIALDRIITLVGGAAVAGPLAARAAAGDATN